MWARAFFFFLQIFPLSVLRPKERSGQPWRVIMACHFSSTFLTMHDPDWSQNTHLGSWHTAQKYITWVRRSVSVMNIETRRTCIRVCACVCVWACPIRLNFCAFFLYFYSFYQDVFLKRKSSTRGPRAEGPLGEDGCTTQTPKPTLSPLLKLDPRSNQRQLGVVGGN